MKYIDKIVQYVKREMFERKFFSNRRDAKLWLFGEWFGHRCNDNCLYLANYIAQIDPGIRVYWAARNDADVSALNERIKVVYFGSTQAETVFRQAGVVIMNQGYVDFSESGYNYFRGAVTVNLWHGIPWKKIGHDASKVSGPVHEISMRIIDYFDRQNYFLSVSGNYSRILKSALHVSGKQIIRAGYPRNSGFYSTEWVNERRNEVLELIARCSDIPVTDKTKIIVYMPTFRDNKSIFNSLECLNQQPEFVHWLEQEDIVIVQKAHYVSQSRKELNAGSESHSRIVAINDIQASVILAAADILISDYSGCFFDYLILDRPIIHYLYDYDEYKNRDRGLYYDKEDVVCGKVATNIDELQQCIYQYVKDTGTDADLRAQRRVQYLEYESSNSCEDIYLQLKKIAASENK